MPTLYKRDNSTALTSRSGRPRPQSNHPSRSDLTCLFASEIWSKCVSLPFDKENKAICGLITYFNLPASVNDMPPEFQLKSLNPRLSLKL